MILTLGNDAILMSYQINVHYNTYAHDSAFHHINKELHFAKLIPINDSLRKPFNLTVLNRLIFDRVYGSWILSSLLSTLVITQ